MQTTLNDKPSHPAAHRRASGGSHSGMYGRLALMLALSYVAMYALMYSMVDALGDAIPNFGQAYMAALMTAPMGLLELALMARMYPDKRMNLVIASAMIALFALGWFGM